MEFAKKNKVNVDKILDDFSDLVWDKVISEKEQEVLSI